MQMQIDVLRIENNTAVCNMYTEARCIRIVMTEADYEALKRDGFFIRSGKEKDSAGVINTSKEYAQIEYVDGHMKLAI